VTSKQRPLSIFSKKKAVGAKSWANGWAASTSIKAVPLSYIFDDCLQISSSRFVIVGSTSLNRDRETERQSFSPLFSLLSSLTFAPRSCLLHAGFLRLHALPSHLPHLSSLSSCTYIFIHHSQRKAKRIPTFLIYCLLYLPLPTPYLSAFQESRSGDRQDVRRIKPNQTSPPVLPPLRPPQRRTK
jgi:hypothetical protein